MHSYIFLAVINSFFPEDFLTFCVSRQQVQEEHLSAVVDWLTVQPRAAQLVDKDSSFVSTLEYHLGRYLKDVKRHYVKADKRLKNNKLYYK